jgi:hypothetical protein
MQRRQVFDLPPMTVRVIEHQLIARRCVCGTTTCGNAPDGVTAPVQYGPRITAIVVYLYVGQFLSKKRTAAALAELFGTPVGDATVATMTKRAADRLDGFLAEFADRIAESEVAGFDETGLRVAGTLYWVHCARAGKYTLITCHPKRGRAGIDAAGVLGRLSTPSSRSSPKAPSDSRPSSAPGSYARGLQLPPGTARQATQTRPPACPTDPPMNLQNPELRPGSCRDPAGGG